jgi:DNA-binding IclR family transcriptional regulator
MRTIKSARRVLEILEYFDRGHRTATVMDMSRSLDYPQSSTSELLRCLAKLGYLHYNRVRRTYSPTARVALLGSWVEPTLFRGGSLLTALDRVAEAVGETVVLSTAANYVIQHLHVIDGAHENAVFVHTGDTESLLHSPQGRLVLGTYQEDHIRSALHRLNAEEPNPERRVKVKETAEELRKLSRRGWLVQPEVRDDGTGVIVMLMPLRKGRDRLVLSVFASRETIETRAKDILRIMAKHRNALVPVENAPQPAAAAPPRAFEGMPVPGFAQREGMNGQLAHA